MSILLVPVTVLISLISISYKLQRFAIVSVVAIAGLVVPRWTTHRKINALTGSNPFKSRFRNLIAFYIILYKYSQVYVCFILKLLGISETVPVTC